MIAIKNTSDCSGCGACTNNCPSNCIYMSQDDEGFLYPIVDKSKCIDCGLCEKLCPVIYPEKCTDFNKRAFACYSKSEKIRFESSSGGIFSELANYVLNTNGIVFGAAFSDDFKSVKHIAIDNADDLYKLRGSKYLQSDTNDTFIKAKAFLEEDRLVLYSGTPCEIAGLRKYLKKDYDNLLTQDLVCHGSPSPLVWKSYVEYREKASDSKVTKISFRLKKGSWKSFSLLFQFKNNKEYIENISRDIYMQGFLKNIYLRPSCYDCKFKSGKSGSDITLADFWGIENILPEMNDDKGTSLVIINSEKGKELFEKIKDRLTLKEVSFDQSIKYNPPYYESVPMPKVRKKFFRLAKKYGYIKAIQIIVKIPFYKKIVHKSKNTIKKMLVRR